MNLEGYTQNLNDTKCAIGHPYLVEVNKSDSVITHYAVYAWSAREAVKLVVDLLRNYGVETAHCECIKPLTSIRPIDSLN